MYTYIYIYTLYNEALYNTHGLPFYSNMYSIPLHSQSQAWRLGQTVVQGKLHKVIEGNWLTNL